MNSENNMHNMGDGPHVENASVLRPFSGGSTPGFSVLYDEVRVSESPAVSRVFEVLDREGAVGRQRRDQIRVIVGQLVYNLEHALATERGLQKPAPVWVALNLQSTQGRDRYRREHFSYARIRRILDGLKRLGWIDVYAGRPGWANDGLGKATHLRATMELASILERSDSAEVDGTRSASFAGCSGSRSFLLPKVEVVVLRDKPERPRRSGKKSVEVQYVDNDATRAMRRHLNDLNARLDHSHVTLSVPLGLVHVSGSTVSVLPRRNTSHSISCRGSNPSLDLVNVSDLCHMNLSKISHYTDCGHVSLLHYMHSNSTDRDGIRFVPAYIKKKPEAKYERLKRYLRFDSMHCDVSSGTVTWTLPYAYKQVFRSFSRGSWEKGGRFFAPFQELSKTLREHLTIDGEPTVEVDYPSLHFNLLYHGLGLEMTEEVGRDAYDVGLDVPRTTLKIVANSMLNAPNYQSLYRMLKAKDADPKEVLDLNGHSAKDVVHALKRLHEPIAGYFHSDIGIDLQFVDSRIAERVLSRMTVLPVHDSFVAPRSRVQELRRVMADAYEVVVGRRIALGKPE
ncbi:hypothetical protein [Rubrivirga marina]|uniref:Uncharacterized protein n=1 Tax=Rubrivirga marina TaxID=1196024 RepID=A0A271J0B7_9BACT|nr:hypothetical protein [Rubrivirga marina]PAP76951.1 hypothetical protein BSZ37_11165 [Rubrivirga marina]